MWNFVKRVFLFPFRLLNKLIPQRVKDLVPVGLDKIKRSLRLQLIIAFGVCLLASTIVASIARPFTVTRYAELEYQYSIANIDRQAKEMVEEIRDIEGQGTESHIYMRARNYYQQNPDKWKLVKDAGEQQVPVQPSMPAKQEGAGTQPPNPVPGEQATPPAGQQGSSVPPAPVMEQEKPASPLALPVELSLKAEQGPPSSEDQHTEAVTAILPPLTKGQVLQAIMDDFSSSDLKVLLTDLDGKVLLRSERATENQVDIHNIIQNAMDQRNYDQGDNRGREYTSFYPVSISREKMYLIATAIPHPDIIYKENDSFIPTLLAFASFILLFYYMTRRRMQEIRDLADGLKEIATGDLNYRVPQRSKDELGSLAENINYMAEKLQDKIEEERQAERTKNELITNVSHDLRTPLTSVLGYLQLLKDKKFENEEQREQYVDIVHAKSEQIVKLVESLFEYTKLSNAGAKLEKREVCLNELLDQLTDELYPLAESSEVKFQKHYHYPPQKVIVRVDPDKIVRAFENLLINAIKYSQKPSDITLSIETDHEKRMIRITFSNACEEMAVTQLNRLFDRFYRVDTSRSSDTGGSGLGLAITKSIIELHQGTIDVKYEEGTIAFIIDLPLS
ncbi:ATP-binding protein [Ammoniphilus sp. 3BR4]|uniref:sensor histidine kinase n=1 Tax=Ammoniphilus sp. 3BR4 TaxID=3158265 RepID=UPI0034679A94